MAAVRRRLSVEEKRRILDLYDQLPCMSQKKAAVRLNITQSLLWNLLRSRSLTPRGAPPMKQGRRKPSLEEALWRLEAALWSWIDGRRTQGAPVSDLMVHRKAVDLAEQMGVEPFRASPTWFSGFKQREQRVRERYHILQDQNHTGPPHLDPGSTSDPEIIQIQQTKQDPEQQNGVVQVKQEPEEPTVPSEPTVIRAEVSGSMQTITVPSLLQMKQAMKTLSTGLLYRGFCDFSLLHRFEKEVNHVVRRSMAQGSQDSFLA